VLTRWLKDVATQTNPHKRANPNKLLGGGDELNTMVRDIYGIVDSCIDRLVTNMEDLSLYKDKQQELKKDVETNTSVMPPMSNREVIAIMVLQVMKKSLSKHLKASGIKDVDHTKRG